MSEHDALRHDLGAYVLGALEPAERDRLERHLADCSSCRDELADLAVLPGLLSRLRGDAALVDVSGPPAVGPVLERIAAERRRARRRSRWSAALAAAALVIAAASVGFSLPPEPPAAGTVYVAAEGGATALVVPRAWGMVVELAADELPERPGYVARAVAHDGHTAQIASWTAVDRPVRLEGSCYLPADEVARVEIVAAPGDELLRVLRPT